MAASNGQAPQGVAAALLDFAQPVDVPLLDSVVTAFYTASSTQEVRAWGALWAAPTRAVRALGRLRLCRAPLSTGSDHRSVWKPAAGRQPALSCPPPLPPPAARGRVRCLGRATCLPTSPAAGPAARPACL